MKLKYLLSDLYAPFFSAKFREFSIVELKATCQQCIQAPHKYKEDLKCCTFWPFIPNYIVGAILSESKERYGYAQRVIKELIKNKDCCLPIGIVAPSWYQVAFKRNKPKVFGKNKKFLCPYYQKESNNCSIWQYRGSVCTSFYCESSYGKKGIEFWHSLENYLSYLEMSLAEEVLAYGDYSPREMSNQLDFVNFQGVSPQKGVLSKEAYKKIWKHNTSKEEEFYIKAYFFIKELPKEQIKDIIGEFGKNLFVSLEEIKGQL